MWVARQWSPCIPHTQFTTINPAAMCLPVAVPVNRLSTGIPKKFQLYSQLRNLDLGYTAEKKQQTRKKSQTKQRAEEQVEEKQGNSKKKLSGIDVLQALEKARAQKMKKKRNGRDSSLLSSRKVTEQRRNGTPEDEAVADYKIVRPLGIKEDWGSRLDELEKRLVDTTPAASICTIAEY
ncbi:uncharacterized protein LOC129876633 [Solanum dulcamara]|uniref:uncharacterized protein LOC129876633 n=1 Tax=Solanum dulcamara TaxID=45834 RepID=UPI002485FB7F|nr:uncharacterized protein LOC129876633 [Solanum dulcamara]